MTLWNVSRPPTHQFYLIKESSQIVQVYKVIYPKYQRILNPRESYVKPKWCPVDNQFASRMNVFILRTISLLI